MTTKRQGGGGSGEGGGSGRGGRPRIKSSHEKVGGGSERTRKPKRITRGGVAARAGGPARTTPAARVSGEARDRGDRAQGLKKARSPQDGVPDKSGAYSFASDAARARASAIAVAALDKKAVGLEILDVAGKVDYADFLVIMTGRSDRHAMALAQGIEEEMRKRGVRPVALEGLPHGSWVLMDFGDVVVHVFQDDSRRLYDIEGLWMDAKRLPVPEDQPEKPGATE